MLWTIHKDTKNESNSQLFPLAAIMEVCCELYTKIQKMKAIHNHNCRATRRNQAVNYTQRYKKWKQFTTDGAYLGGSSKLWTIHKDTKNESNSQLCQIYHTVRTAVNYTQRYKKWKQFTTVFCHRVLKVSLWTIHKDTKNESNSQLVLWAYCRCLCCELYTKIQKMKAIHNTF